MMNNHPNSVLLLIFLLHFYLSSLQLASLAAIQEQEPLKLELSAKEVRPRQPIFGALRWLGPKANRSDVQEGGMGVLIGKSERIEPIEMNDPAGGLFVGGGVAVFGQHQGESIAEIDGRKFFFRATLPGEQARDDYNGRINGAQRLFDGSILYYGFGQDEQGIDVPVFWFHQESPRQARSAVGGAVGEFQSASALGTLVGIDHLGGIWVEMTSEQIQELPLSDAARRIRISWDGRYICGGSFIWERGADGQYHLFPVQNFDFNDGTITPSFVAVDCDELGMPLFVGEFLDPELEITTTRFWNSQGDELGSFPGKFGGMTLVHGRWVIAMKNSLQDYLVRLDNREPIPLRQFLGFPAKLAGENPLFASPNQIGLVLLADDQHLISIHPTGPLIDPDQTLPQRVDVWLDTTGDGEFNEYFEQTDFEELNFQFRKVGQYQITAIALDGLQEIARITQSVLVTRQTSDIINQRIARQNRKFLNRLNRQSATRRSQPTNAEEIASLALRQLNTTTEIVILAAGETNDETIQLLIDEQIVNTWTNLGGNLFSGQFQTLTHVANQAVSPGQIRIAFVNDLWDPANNYDRNVRIDAIIVNGIRYETEAPNVFSTGTWRPEDGVVPGFRNSEILHTNGYFQFSDSGSTIEVRARGDEGGEVFQILVDEVPVATFTTTTNYQTFRHQANAPVSAEQIRIAFINDFWDPVNNIDRNLQVDFINIDSIVYQTEDSSVFSTGTWIAGVGIEPGFWQSEYLHTNGYFHFNQFSDQGDFSLASSLIRVAENETVAAINIVRNNGTNGAVSLDFRTVDNTAIAGQHYLAVSGRLQFAAGETFKTVEVPLIDNDLIDGDKQFIFTIDNVSGNARLLPPRTATIIIEDDDRIRAEGNGLMGEYYDDLNFSNLFIARVDPQINFNWGTGAPANGMAADRFTVRWRGRIEPRFTEVYTFRTRTDDGVRLWVNDQLIIDRWIDQSATVHSGTLSLQAGVLYDIQMEYYENSGAAVAELFWQSNSQTSEIVPTSQLYAAQPPIVVPGGQLQAQTLITGLVNPTAIDFVPDGSLMYIAEQRGLVRTVANGVLQAAPFIDLRNQVNGVRDRGLLGIAVHPQFPAIPYVYFLYTYDPPEVFQNAAGTLAGPNGRGNRAGRLTRVSANPATDYQTAIPGSEVVLLGTNSTWQNFNGFVNSTVDFNEPPAGILPNGTNLIDFINSDSESHTIGDLKFASDGSLLVSIGDGTSYNQVDPRTRRVQDIDNLSGKVLRINPLTGEGLPSNPFFDGNPNSNRSKVLHYGLRNPFRMSVNPNSGQLYIGDVGWGQWEEINSAPAGANFGWPWYEGGSGTNLRTNGYRNLAEALAFYNSGATATPAFYALPHSSGINAIVLGDVYTGTLYPENYRGSLFFNDLGRGIVSHIRFNSNGTVNSVATFATNHRLVVQIRMGPDQNLYYVDLDDGLVGRWRFVD